MPEISYTLFIDGEAAASNLLEAVQEIEVEDHAELADMMRLRLAGSVDESGSHWTFLDDDLFSRLTPLALTVKVGSTTTETLFDGFVIETKAEFANEPGASTLEIIAMDGTVLMNLEEKIRAWPDMSDSDIAETIFGEYGFTTNVEATQPVRQEIDYLTTQRGTDIQFLRYLARRNGYEAYVEINPSSGETEGHFHPPQLDQPPQGVLSVNLGTATNVDTFNARYAMLRPTAAAITGLNLGTLEEQPVEIESTSLTEQGSASTLNGDRPRRIVLTQTGLDETVDLQHYVQAVVDRSSWAIEAQGELRTVTYGGILRAKRPVEVRGAGRLFSGLYYINKVLHFFTGDGYAQRFMLQRNALGLTGQERFVEDDALP